MSKIFIEKELNHVSIKFDSCTVKCEILAISHFNKANEYALECDEDLFTSIILNQSNKFMRKEQVVDILFSHYVNGIYYACVITKNNTALCISYKSNDSSKLYKLMNHSKCVPESVKECDVITKYKFEQILTVIN